MKFNCRLKRSYHFIDLTPLVDVVFLLLIFFLITSNTLPLKSLHIENPSLPTNSTPLTTQIMVAMDAQHVLYVGSNKEIVDFVTFKQQLMKEKMRLQNLHPYSVEPTIVLNIDRRVDYETFLRLLSLTQECSSRVRLAYSPEVK